MACSVPSKATRRMTANPMKAKLALGLRSGWRLWKILRYANPAMMYMNAVSAARVGGDKGGGRGGRHVAKSESKHKASSGLLNKWTTLLNSGPGACTAF